MIEALNLSSLVLGIFFYLLYLLPLEFMLYLMKENIKLIILRHLPSSFTL
jgi:hypothetical protein